MLSFPFACAHSNMALSLIHIFSATGTAYSYAGGIAGYCYAMDTGYVVNCSVEPTSVVFSHMDTGGVVGGFANQVYNCVSAAASVTVDGHNPNEAGYFTGGIVGAFGTAYNCYCCLLYTSRCV